MNQPPITAVGIDLGTTYSAVAMLDDHGKPHTLANAEGDKITPSALLFENDQVIVGKEAVKAKATHYEAVAEHSKRHLGKRDFQQSFNDTQYPPEALQAWILNKLRQDTQQQVGRLEHVVITVPAYFDEARRKATQDAGFMAGLNVLDIINEPTAAAIAYGIQQSNQSEVNSTPRNILVYDLGGGTFDVSILEITSGQLTTLATDGDVLLGGIDWDQRIVDLIAEEFIRTHGSDPREDPNTEGRLWRDAQEAKHTLTARETCSIACDYQGNAIRTTLSREQFERTTQDLLERTRFTTIQTLAAAELEWADIDRILLVGGSTRMPAVDSMLTTLSDRPLDRSVSPDEAVAHGAALHAGRLLDELAGNTPAFSVTDVNSHSLGVIGVEPSTGRPRTGHIIPRNTPLPITAKRHFKLRPGQTSIMLQVVEGESRSPDACILIGQCEISGIPADLPPDSKLEVRFRYRTDGRLTMRFVIHNTDIKLQHEFIRDNSLTQEQLEAWRGYISEVPLP
ncbi:MAG: Hsp70 family protein [Planctomycetota bacterium]|nr:Hsp70 family protein [Planctomycetota bacterium]